MALVDNTEKLQNLLDAARALPDAGGDTISGITDVQVEGTSVVTDKIASIPRASNTTFGVVKAGNGTIVHSSGVLGVSLASNAEIDRRANWVGAVTPANLDYAVKAALTDGVGEEWTSEEQTAAKTRLGITGGGSSGGISDVKIGENSIVADGVATIPITKNDGKTFGAVSIAAGSCGLQLINGVLYVRQTQTSDIDTRTAVNRDRSPLSLEKINYAVTAALTDENHITLTDEQKATAKEVFGITEGSGGGITDVQVDSTSIVVDGVANVPMAVPGNASVVIAGAFIPFENSFTTLNIGSGKVAHILKDSSVTVLTGRYTNGRPVTAYNYDQAVKHALCDAPTGSGNDLGKALTWTAEEQQAAQQRLGILSVEGVTF